MTGYHIQNGLLASSKGQVYRNDWLEFLLQGEAGNVFYDLDMAVAALLRYAGATQEQGKRLLDTHKLHIAPYTFSYYPGKLFSIDQGYGRGHPYNNFYNARQFTDVHHQESTNTEELISKAKEAEEIAKQVLDAYRELGIHSDSLTSPIAAFDKSGMMPNTPTMDDIPQEAHELAYSCVKGNWLECYQLGYFPKTYDYDINSAYASELARLLDVRRGRWTQDYENGAVYSFIKGTLRTNTPFHPFLVSSGEMSYTPTGEWETVLTLQEIRFLERYKLGSFERKEGWYWIPNNQPGYEPYKGIVTYLWKKRQETQSQMTSSIVKRLLAGMWGKTLELRGTPGSIEFGPRFNPVYGAIVETNNRLKVAQTCLDNGIIPLSVAVDGIITDRPLNMPLGNNPGQWRLSHNGRCVIISSGIVGMEGKEANEDFSIKFDWLMERLSANPEAAEYQMVKLAPITLAKAIAENKWEKLGELEQMERTIYIDGENKRCYPQRPKCGQDILDGQYGSMPWDISMIRQEVTLW